MENVFIHILVILIVLGIWLYCQILVLYLVLMIGMNEFCIRFTTNSIFIKKKSCSTLRIWTIEGQCIRELSGHESFVYSVDVLPTGEIVSSGEDRSIRVWRGLKKIFFFAVVSYNIIFFKIILSNLYFIKQITHVSKLYYFLQCLYGMLLQCLMVTLLVVQVVE